jgi:beta-lactam-binding protein with PASTA domain
MADSRSGPSTATIALIALIATPVVLFIIFWLVGSGSASASSNLPDLRGKGLAWAKAESKNAGFGRVSSHDALGRDRGWHDDKDWMVCFEAPAPGSRKAGTKVELGVVKIEERCPSTDQAIYKPAVTTMPDLTGKTAFIASKILGKNASVKYLDKSNGHNVGHGLGDWRVCSQAPQPGQTFNGVPVTTLVVPYDDRC